MKIEYLYPELGNLFGDSANVRYLRQCLPEAEYVETALGQEPAFASDEEVVFLYSGPMTERAQRFAAQALLPYADKLAQRVEQGLHCLFTGNSMELLGKGIETADGPVTGLGLFDFTARQDLTKRHNSLFYGLWKDIPITAFNSRFSHAHPGSAVEGFAKVIRGIGLEEGCSFEGVQKSGCIGTYLLGPLLVLNPLFTQKLLEELGAENPVPAHFEAAMAAYEKRKKEFENKRTKLD